MGALALWERLERIFGGDRWRGVGMRWRTGVLSALLALIARGTLQSICRKLRAFACSRTLQVANCTIIVCARLAWSLDPGGAAPYIVRCRAARLSCVERGVSDEQGICQATCDRAMCKVAASSSMPSPY